MEWTKITNIKYYRIWYSDGNDRTELGKVKAKDIDTVEEFCLKQFIKEDARDEIEIESSSEDQSYLTWYEEPECEFCDFDKDSEECEFCEQPSYYIEIEETDDTEESFKTIFGTDDFWDLTKNPPRKNPNWGMPIVPMS